MLETVPLESLVEGDDCSSEVAAGQVHFHPLLPVARADADGLKLGAVLLSQTDIPISQEHGRSCMDSSVDFSVRLGFYLFFIK